MYVESDRDGSQLKSTLPFESLYHVVLRNNKLFLCSRKFSILVHPAFDAVLVKHINTSRNLSEIGFAKLSASDFGSPLFLLE